MAAKKPFTELHKINLVLAETELLYHQAALKLGLADSAMRVLYTVLDNKENCTLAEVYRQSAISKQTVHSAICKLEAQEILYIKTNADGVKMIELTPKGQAYMQKTAGRLQQAEREIYADWSEEEIAQLVRLNCKYNEAMKEKLKTL